MSRNKGPLAERFTQRLGSASNQREVGKILEEVKYAGLSHGALLPAGAALPGYQFDEEFGRYRRVQQAAGPTVVDISLAAQAKQLAPLLEKGYRTEIDERIAAWKPRGSRSFKLGEVAPYLNRVSSPKERAERVRHVLMLATAPLAVANANGDWGSLPNGNLGAKGAADVLTRPFTKSADPITAPGDVTWNAHTLDVMPAIEVRRRREVVREISHPPFPIEKLDRSGNTVRHALGRRAFQVVQDTYFAVDPEMADMSEQDLDVAVQTHGDGLEEFIVPVAGFVTVNQLFKPLST